MTPPHRQVWTKNRPRRVMLHQVLLSLMVITQLLQTPIKDMLTLMEALQ